MVEPQAHELGLGTRLVDDCLHFARQGDYQTVTLWSNSVRLATRRIYEAAGFWLVPEESHHSFGPALIGETWELQL